MKGLVRRRQPSASEPEAARAEGIALFSVFIYWALPLCGRRLSGFTVRFFNLKVKRTLRPYSRLRHFTLF